MNSLIPVITLAAMLSAFGDDTPAPVAANAPEELPVAPAEPPPGDAAPTSEPNSFEKSQAKFDKARKHYAELRKEADEQAAQAARAAVAELAGNRYIKGAQNAGRGSAGNPNRALVIRTGEADPKEQANFEEDLTIMSHLLDRALKDNLGPGWDRKAMGIDVFFAPGGTPVRSLYVEGYGALFLAGVTFPVLAPASEADAPKEKPAADSSWDEAKREVYGHGEGKTSSGEQFNEEKSTKLRNSLLEALKNATNIRGLKPDDAITVCVLGPPLPLSSKAKARPAPEPDAGDAAPRPAKNISAGKPSIRGTVLTLRILKSDADAFANGKLNLDRFREKAKFTSYAGSTMSSANAMNFITSGVGGSYGGGGYAVGNSY